MYQNVCGGLDSERAEQCCIEISRQVTVVVSIQGAQQMIVHAV